jgi:hypothetical protein
MVYEQQVPTCITGHTTTLPEMQWCKMLDTGGYELPRYTSQMFYHLQACIVDERCLDPIICKVRRTGFTYVVLSIMLNDSTGTRNNNFGITSRSQMPMLRSVLEVQIYVAWYRSSSSYL